MERRVRIFLHRVFLLTLAAAALLPAAARSQTDAESHLGAGWQVVNQAHALYQDHDAAPSTALSSNTTLALVPLDPPSLQWYSDAAFTRRATVADHGQLLYVQVSSDGCDLNPQVVNHVQILIGTDVSHDEENYDGVETGPDTGIYRIVGPVRLAASGAATVQHNDLLETGPQDVVHAWVDGCGTGEATGAVLIDPVGTVFDSQTNEPVRGVNVRLIDVTGAGNGGFAGGAAHVFDFDGITRVPSAAVTDADGVYQFPLVAPSVYRLVVAPPGDYRFPSTTPADQLPRSRIVRTGSHGQDFDVNADTGTVLLDVPLDSPTEGLFLQKKASRDTVEITDTLQYTVTMRNTSGLELARLRVTDTLPPGFSYLKNTARLDGVAIADPSGGKGPTLEFPIDALTATDRTLTYRVAVGAGALEGDGINRAVLRSASPARKVSNTASAGVRVEGGVFDDRAYVLGNIFADCNANSIQDAGEPGLPRVRLYMEDGSFVISDGKGKYSFYGVSPRTHVLKVDATTLPTGMTMSAISHRHAKDGKSQFVDVQRSEMHRADFAAGPCSDVLMQSLISMASPAADVESNSGGLGRELNLGLQNELKPAGEPDVGDVRALAASGVIGEASGARAVLRAPTVKPVDSGSTLQTMLAGANNNTDFIGLIDGDEVGTVQIAVRVKGMAGSTFDLQVNDQAVAIDRVGTRVVDRSRKLEAWEFIGVDLRPGRNSLKLVQRDPFGNARDIREIALIAPDQMARIKIAVPSEKVPAGGEQVAPRNACSSASPIGTARPIASTGCGAMS